MKVKIDNLAGFSSNVFGAGCFLANWPEIKTTGIDVIKQVGPSGGILYYVAENGRRVNDSAFFTPKEMRYLKVITPKEGDTQ
jgi:hypothetical protein